MRQHHSLALTFGISLIAITEVCIAQATIAEEIRQLEESLTDSEKLYVAALEANHGKKPYLQTQKPLRTSDCGTFALPTPDVIMLRQVISKSEMLVSGSGKSREELGLFWIEGVSSGDATTDTEVSFGENIFVVAGTKTFKNAIGGTTTAKHLVAVDAEKCEDVREQILQLQLFHSWTLADGHFLAKVAKTLEGNVQLLGYDEKVLVVPITSLNQKDQKWLQDHLRSRSQADRYRDEVIVARIKARAIMKSEELTGEEREYVATYVNNFGKRPSAKTGPSGTKKVEDILVTPEVKAWAQAEILYQKELKSKGKKR